MVATLIITITVPLIAQDEIEVGLSMAPLHMVSPDDGSENFEEGMPENMSEDYYEKDFLDEWLVGLHLGYNMGILYASLDSFVMAPFMVSDMTSGERIDESGDMFFSTGIEKPGFLNFIDVGIKLNLSKFVFFAETGINHLYIYRQSELKEEDKPGTLGSNLRIGASYRIIDNLSVGLTGTAIFPSFESMGNALKGLAGDEEYAESADQVKF
jgi:hypothetical protein